ncbi:50S ribosomal protein L32 [Microgenomates bacterium DG_75]|nr:MAG: 50S ribosomal protein L32 [Microgenomates bacterium DG_75]
MGALPKRRISTGRKGRRRATRKLKVPKLVPCANCGQPKKPHQACPYCGYYKGREMVKIKIKKGKKKEK